MIEIVLDGVPIPYQATRKGKNSFYNPRHEVKQQVQWQIRSQYRSEPIKGPVFQDIIFYMPIPLSTSRIRRLEMMGGLYHHIKKPDLDNLEKFLNDCLKEIVIADDSQICDKRIRKVYAERPGIVVKISRLDLREYEKISLPQERKTRIRKSAKNIFQIKE